MGAQATDNQSSGHLKANGKAMYLLTAGGKIICLRCTASSTRTKKQCAKPALKTSTTQKCEFHGGRPHSAEVLRRISEANTLHGECTKEAKEQFRQDAVQIRHWEDAMHLLQKTEGTRMRGRKPIGYRPVSKEMDLVRIIRQGMKHCM